MKVFLDTNVFLDAMLENRQFKEAPVKILNLCSQKRIDAYTSDISFANITYFIQKATRGNVEVLLRAILEDITIVSFEKADFIKALKFGFADIEDAYQGVAAEKIGDVDYLITRNIKDFKKSSIPVITPEDFVKKFLS